MYFLPMCLRYYGHHKSEPRKNKQAKEAKNESFWTLPTNNTLLGRQATWRETPLGVRMFNALPENMRTLEFSKFKNKLKHWLTAKPFFIPCMSNNFEVDKSELDSTSPHLAEVLQIASQFYKLTQSFEIPSFDGGRIPQAVIRYPRPTTSQAYHITFSDSKPKEVFLHLTIPSVCTLSKQ